MRYEIKARTLRKIIKKVWNRYLIYWGSGTHFLEGTIFDFFLRKSRDFSSVWPFNLKGERKMWRLQVRYEIKAQNLSNMTQKDLDRYLIYWGGGTHFLKGTIFEFFLHKSRDFSGHSSFYLTGKKISENYKWGMKWKLSTSGKWSKRFEIDI